MDAQFRHGDRVFNDGRAAVGDRLDDQFSDPGHGTGVLDLDAELHALTDTGVLAQENVLNLKRGLLFDEGVFRFVLGLAGEDRQDAAVFLGPPPKRTVEPAESAPEIQNTSVGWLASLTSASKTGLVIGQGPQVEAGRRCSSHR